MVPPRIHNTALVESDDIGQGTAIWAFVHVMKGAHIGANCNIGDNCFVESGVIVGDNVTLKNSNMLFEGLVLEEGVFVGPHVFFTNDRYPRSPRLPEAASRYHDKSWLVSTRVERGASLGAAAVLIAGVTIGKYAMVGAGSVVSKDVAPHALVIGAPAHRVGWVCRCGEKLNVQNNTADCKTCGDRYVIEGEMIRRLELS